MGTLGLKEEQKLLVYLSVPGYRTNNCLGCNAGVNLEIVE